MYVRDNFFQTFPCHNIKAKKWHGLVVMLIMVTRTLGVY